MQTNKKSSTSTFSDTKKDFKVAWQLLKGNYKAFIGTETFAGLAFIITLFILGSILMLIVALIPSLSVSDFFGRISENFGISMVFRLLMGLIAISIFYAFLNSQHGLAYDIMSSGEMFAEFKNSFTYFKRFWWQYPILSFSLFIINGLFSVLFRMDGSGPPFHDIDMDFVQIIIILGEVIFFFIWFIFFIHTFPSLTSQGNFKRSFIESIRIIKSNPKRIISTWGTYFLIFVVPIIIIAILAEVYGFIIFYVLLGILFILVSLFGFPMLSLLACGIYNNVEFKRFKQKLKE
ncbi:hypothetical protein DSAG12_00247 [Promethearchaeum syntrophicum]|uniref:Glycerophosphoryl diester phosphodiesterase membrane domain-containing protein n=1 Tax=Promethearchaeum syntrophicum TaxID=2594042 RepID=A0A5B9D5S3_9ARCH|nr:hypothetical protein [Candidatus Prometheoarchaeum syntrophicum]QEE14434.1 hypothetical protein DSAG12_00247 [Candidatus Prometheoarchaeum syntrophicum]